MYNLSHDISNNMVQYYDLVNEHYYINVVSMHQLMSMHESKMLTNLVTINLNVTASTQTKH